MASHYNPIFIHHPHPPIVRMTSLDVRILSFNESNIYTIRIVSCKAFH